MPARARFALSIVILLFGLVSFDAESWRWNLVQIPLFTLPLILQLARSAALQAWGLWGGIFLILQSLLSPLVGDPDFLTLPPNLDIVSDVGQGAVNGICGKQHITTDSRGFRTLKPIDYRHKQGFRIFAIGGSTTEDLALDDSKTWTHVLQEELIRKTGKNVEVVNTGLSGTRAKNHLATLRAVIPLHPDLVIFLVGINDWNRHILETFSGKKDGAREKLNDFRARLCLRRTMLGSHALGAYHLAMSKTAGSARRVNYEATRPSQVDSLNRPVQYSFHPTEVYPEYRTELAEISSLCRKNGIPCLFLTQATGYRPEASAAYRKSFWMTPPYERYTVGLPSLVYLAAFYNNFLIEFARKSGDLVCDAAASIAPTYENFTDDCHFTTEGARKFGIVVSDCVKSHVR